MKKSVIWSLFLIAIMFCPIWISVVQADSNLTTGLVAYWKCDEGTGTTAVDSSIEVYLIKTQHNATLSGANWTDGIIGEALSFDGDDDYVSLSSESGQEISDNPNGTYAAWIYVKSNNSYLFESSRIFTIYNTQLRFISWYDTDLQRYSADNAIPQNQWVHVAVTWDGTTNASAVHIYVNGTEVSYSYSSDGVGERQTIQVFRIGNNFYNNYDLNGSMDEIAVWNRALSPSEIQELYNLTSHNNSIPLSPINTVPEISFFDNYSVYLPNQATLATLVLDDGLPSSSLTTNWSKVSGPGTVTFSNQYYPITDVVFSAAGDYVLRLNASDGELSDYRDVNVTVLPEPIKIQVKKSGTGTGTVSSLEDYIDCGSDCSETFDEDSPISLTATPSSGSVFIGWVGSGCLGNSSNVCNVTVNGTKEVTAFFDTEGTGLNVYYVSNSGSDSNNGSIDFPWLTIQHAADTATAGDKVIVKAGIYSEFLTFPNSGTEESPIIFEGERNAEGEWSTIIDPSTSESSGWIAAPEIGPGVYKKDVGFNTSELTINNKKVARVWSMGNMSTLIDYGYGSSVSWTTGADLLNVSSDYLINEQRFWDGLEAFWGHSGNTTYLRLRNGTNPNGMEIHVTPELNTFEISGKSYLDFRNFNVRNINTGFVLESSSHHIIVESNSISTGSYRVYLNYGPYQNIIRNNEITDNFYGYSDPGTFEDTVVQSYRQVIRQYHYLLVKWIMDDSGGGYGYAISLMFAGNNNTISGNHIFKVFGVELGIYGYLNNPTANTEIYDNIMEYSPAIGVLMYLGNNNTKIHDNLFIDNNLNMRIHHSGAENETQDRIIYLYRNKFWLPKGSGVHIWVHYEHEGGTGHLPELWAYHNTFVGGYNGLGLGGVYNPIPDMNFINNVFSGTTYLFYIGPNYQDNDSLIGVVDYNFVAPLYFPYVVPYPVWYGEHNINQSNPLWGYYAIPDFLLSEDSPPIDAGIDLSQPFTINGTEYPALPGMELGYFSGEAPDMGAVEYNGSGTASLTALFGINPINNYDSDSENITFDFKCSYNSTIDTIQLWTNITGWNINYTNSSYTNGTWLNITIYEIPEGSYKWAVWCNDSEGNSDWTNTNRTFSFTLAEEEEEEEQKKGGGGGGSDEEINQSNTTNVTNNINYVNNSIGNITRDNNTDKSSNENQENQTTKNNLLKYWWLIVIAVVIITLIIIFSVRKKPELSFNVR